MISISKIKYFRSLKYKKYRELSNEFLIEGTRIISSALEANTFLKTVLITDTFKDSPSSQNILKDLDNVGISIKVVNNKTMKSIATTEHPPGIAGVCSLPETQNNFINTKQPFIFLDTISNPGNIGTILRSASWFGIRNVALSPNCVEPFNPKSIRAGMGAHFHLNFQENTLLKTFVKENYWIIGSSPSGSSYLKWENPLKKKNWVLVLGNEANGISEENQALLNEIISIPKYGTGESLNVATSAGILLSHLTRFGIN
jgi:TrmH family RNA methyltransferase